MKNDYLWDRKGEPDPEIHELEQVLGTLRYQPRPLEIPPQLQIERRRFLSPSLAIAATITLLLFGAGLWLVLNHQQPTDLVRSQNGRESLGAGSHPTPLSLPAANSTKEQVINPADEDKMITERQPHHRPLRKTLARSNSRIGHLGLKTTELTASERLEAEAAKDQLLLALRVASAKLSLAQKKAQGTYPTSLIRNQHKVG